MTHVEWSRRAISDFEEIENYLLNNFPSVAARQTDRILTSVEQLKSFALLGRISRVRRNRQFAVPGTPCLIFYRVHQNRIELTMIRHGAQRFPIRSPKYET